MIIKRSLPATSKVPKTSQALHIAKRAIPMMIQCSVEPTPLNYTIWYHYLAGHNNELTKEMNSLIKQAVPFTDDVGLYLHTKYIPQESSEASTKEAAQSTKIVLAELVKIISTLSQEASSYNQELDQHIGSLSELSDNPDVEAMIKQVIKSAASLRESSAQMEEKLHSSQQEIEILKDSLAKVTDESERDFLTGVANRKALDKALEEQTKIAVAQRADLCLLMVDIDHFKTFNDTYGHLIGDEVVKIVAKSLTDSVKGKDFVARYGGEEFAVLLPQTPIGGAMIVADIIRKAIASRDLKRKDTGQSYGHITVSVGVSYFHGAADSIPLFIKRADEALYRSKKSGRNRVTQETM